MQRFQGISVQPVAWPKCLYSFTRVFNAQTPAGQANQMNVCCYATTASTNYTQEKDADLLRSARARWRSKLQPTSADKLPLQPTMSLSTTCARPTTIQLVNNKSVQCKLLTMKLKTYQESAPKSQQRKLSMGCNTQNMQPPNGSSGVVDPQLTDQRVDSHTMNSTNSTKTPLNQQDWDKSRLRTPQPPDPETCCESGCANCVWIRYVQEMQEHAPLDKEQAKKVLELIEDHNVKMFVKMELGL